MNLVCPHCSRDFHIPESWKKKGIKYCSRKCSADARAKVVKCPTCSRDHRVPLGDLLERNYCSRKCYHIGKVGTTYAASAEVRFWEKVQKSPGEGCWEWAANKDSRGYGRFLGSYGPTGAHQFSWFLANGLRPSYPVLHSCDNPGCVNPAHLRLGTMKQNTRDAITRGRIARGSRHGNSKLTEDQVLEIKSSTARAKDVARELGISWRHVYQLRSGRRWAHVKPAS